MINHTTTAFLSLPKLDNPIHYVRLEIRHLFFGIRKFMRQKLSLNQLENE